MPDQVKPKKSWKEPSPGLQKTVTVLTYGFGRASAQVAHKKAVFTEKNKAVNEEIKEFNSKNPENKKHRKLMPVSSMLWAWFSGFSDGVSIRLKQMRPKDEKVVVKDEKVAA